MREEKELDLPDIGTEMIEVTPLDIPACSACSKPATHQITRTHAGRSVSTWVCRPCGANQLINASRDRVPVRFLTRNHDLWWER